MQSVSKKVADLLDMIPGWNDGPIPITVLFKRIGICDDNCRECSELFIAILNSFDVISIVDINDKDGRGIKSRSEIATYFLKSLAIHIREDRKLFSNWERTGVSQGPFGLQALLSGPQFLYILEQNRIENNVDASAIRVTIVGKAIIKARVRGFREPVYLVQFDEQVQKYQLIGGHKRESDNDITSTVRREISEELYKDNFLHELRYGLRHTGQVSAKEVSLTFGVLTEYEIDYFQPIFENSQIILGPNDRWVTLKELLNGKTKNGKGINESAIPTLDKSLSGGLHSLGLSLDEVQHRTLIQIARDHLWETIGIAISAIGIILSIIFFLLSQ